MMLGVNPNEAIHLLIHYYGCYHLNCHSFYVVVVVRKNWIPNGDVVGVDCRIAQVLDHSKDDCIIVSRLTMMFPFQIGMACHVVVAKED
jgi:hypothetical protein